MSAAVRDGWLYVVVAEDLVHLTPPALSAQPTRSGQLWVSQPYTDTPYTYSMRRYPLAVETQPDTGVETYLASIEGEEVLWQGQLALAYGAWSFNADCTACVTVQLPRIAAWCTVYVVEGSSWVASPDQHSSYPQAEANRLELALAHAEDGTVAVTLAQAPAPLLLAEEDGVALTIEEVVSTSLTFRVDIKLDGLALPMTQGSFTPGARWFERRALVHAHIPTRTLLFYRWRTTLDTANYVSAGYELYVDGERVEIENDASVEQGFTVGFWSAATASNFLTVPAMAYDDGVGTSWRRPMDAVTFLLGYTFQTQGALSALGTSQEPSHGFQTCPHVPYAFVGGNYSPHSAAGGFIFGSVGGTPGSLYWGPGFTAAAFYGANDGAYFDDAPSSNPTLGHQGVAVSFDDNTMAVVGLQPLLAVQNSGGLHPLLLAMRHTRFGTNGDAKTLFDALLPEGTWQGFSLSHTGRPRPHQRRAFEWQ
ncbi:MAG: hypothetical protein GX856_08840 [Gammaproteobacteria bacterium]|nr:hypothetical protein [Gammaproteobacteria bacterium]